LEGQTEIDFTAEQSGSAVKSISVCPSNEARFLIRMASIFILFWGLIDFLGYLSEKLSQIIGNVSMVT
jgi:hypothetical protein